MANSKKPNRQITKSNSRPANTKLKIGSNLFSKFTGKRSAIFMAVFAVIGGAIILRSFAASSMWQPTADKPLTLGWVLDSITSANNLQVKNLAGQPIPEADVYDIDGETTPKSVVDALHAKGKKVICYIDAGVWEPVRSDAGMFPGAAEYGHPYTGDPQYANADVVGAIDQGWGQDRWLDIRRIDILKPIMMNRMQKWCKDKGFDSIEPDEITNYSNKSGFTLTYADQIAYNTAVASWAHSLGLSIGLKGDIEQAADLASVFDWSLNEECFMYDECTSYNLQAFTKLNKAVWVAEYPEEYPSGSRSSSTASKLTQAKYDAICATSAQNKFNTAFYVLALPANGGRTDCPPYAATITNPTPTISLSSSNTSPVAPANFTITASSSASSTITISLSGNVVSTCSGANSCTYTASNFAAGTYSFSASASSGSGTANGNLSITVAPGSTTPPPNVSPTVSLSNNTTNLTAPATLSLTATAADKDGSISKVQLFQNGNQVGVDLTKSPYVFSLANTAGGTYNFTAKATDNQGSVTTSNTVTLTVVQPVITDPSPGTAPVWPTGSTISADFHSLWANTNCSVSSTCNIDISWPNATDNVKVTGYEIWRKIDNQASVKVATNTPSDLYFTNKINKSSNYTYQIYARDGSGNRTLGPSKSIKISCVLVVCGL